MSNGGAIYDKKEPFQEPTISLGILHKNNLHNLQEKFCKKNKIYCEVDIITAFAGLF